MFAARQFVSHGHVRVNGRRVNIPSYQVKPDDIVTVRTGSAAEQTVRDATDLTAYVNIHEGSSLIDVWYERVVQMSGSNATLGFQTAGGSSATAYPISDRKSTRLNSSHRT